MSFETIFPNDQTHQQFHTWLTAPNSVLAAYGVLLSIFLYYLFNSLDLLDFLLKIIWNALVYLSPRRLLATLDREFAGDASMQDGDKGLYSRHHQEKGNALRRIFHLDDGGVMKTVRGARTISHLGGIVKSRPAESPPGLGNWDNSCYQNSVLQGLASLNVLPSFLSSTGVETTDTTMSALKNLTSRLNAKENRGRTFWTPAKLKNMSSWQQQDAQEYFSKVLEEVDMDATKAVQKQLRSSGCRGLTEVSSSAPEPSTAGAVQQAESQYPNTPLWASELPEELRSIIVRNPLEGLLAQRVGCKKCGYVEGLSLVPFTCLTLPLGKDWLYDIRQCLDDFTALEAIDGVECVKCTLIQAQRHMEGIIKTLRPPEQDPSELPANTLALCASVQQRLDIVKRALENDEFSDDLPKKCQIGPKNRVSTTKSRQAVVARAPKALVLHVNRSEFNEATGVQSKNYAQIKFPIRLGLGPWYLGPFPNPQGPDVPIEEWNTDPSISMLHGRDSDRDASTYPSYRLRAVVTHYGKHENGHYICYRQSPGTSDDGEEVASDKEDSRSWWRLSDEDVSEVSEETMLAQGGVFMLFYEQIEHHSRSKLATYALVPDQSAVAHSTKTESDPAAYVKENVGLTSSELAQPSLPSHVASAREPGAEEPDERPADNPGAGTSRSDSGASTLSSSSGPSSEGSIPCESTDRQASTRATSLTTGQRTPENALPTPAATPPPEHPSFKRSVPKRSPRSGLGSENAPGPGMESLPGFVQAN